MSETRVWTAFRAICLLLPMACLLSAGCGGKTKQDSLSGKITLGGSAVNGEVTFVGADGKEIKSPIGADGSYSILNPPKGEAKFGIKSLVAGTAPTGAAGSKADMKMPGGGPSGTPAPAKYGNPATSGLTYTVKGGEEKFDITLSP